MSDNPDNLKFEGPGFKFSAGGKFAITVAAILVVVVVFAVLV